MGSRRLNLFVILFVVGLLIGSGVIIAGKRTVLGIDLRGGTQLVYEAQPTPANPTVEGEDIDRAIEIIRDRVDSLGVAEPEISRLGESSIQVGLPDVQDTQRAVDQVGDTAQLYFYDLEPNVIPLDPGTDTVTAANLDQQSTPSLYDAVTLASEQPRECMECTASGSRYYLFDAETEELVAGPEQDRADLFALPEAEALPKGQRDVIEVKQGTIVVRDALTSSGGRSGDGDAPQVDRYFVLRDRPALSGEDLRNPEQNFDPVTNQPNVTFDFTDQGRRIFQEVTRGIAERGLLNFPPQPESFAIVLDEEIVSRLEECLPTAIAPLCPGLCEVKEHDGTIQPHVILTATTAYEASAHFMHGFRVVVVYEIWDRTGTARLARYVYRNEPLDKVMAEEGADVDAVLTYDSVKTADKLCDDVGIEAADLASKGH